MLRPNILYGNLLIVIATAVVYFVAGKLSLMLAIPPGYSAAVWPAAGLALGLVVVRGNIACTGVFIGAFLLILTNLFDTGSSQTLIQSLFISMAIGSGAALQAYVGARILTRHISPNPTLEDMGSISSFVFIVAGGCSVINATIGVCALLLTGIVAPDNFFFNWTTWWTGDAIGVLIFTVLVLTLWGRDKSIWQPRRLTVALPLTIGFLLVLTLFVATNRLEVAEQQESLKSKAEYLLQNLNEAVHQQEHTLHAFAALMAASDQVEREEFSIFAEQPALMHKKGIQAFAWVPFVSHAERGRMEAGAVASGIEGFVFTELVDGQLQPSTDKDFYYPIYYVSPMQGNEMLLGLDLASEEARLDAMNRAIRNKDIAITEAITLVQDLGGQQAVIMFLPYFSTATAAEFLGLFNVVFRVGAFVEAAVSEHIPEGYHLFEDLVLTVTEHKEGGDGRVLFNSSELFPESMVGQSMAHLAWQGSLKVGDRVWMLSAVASQKMISDSRSVMPWSILVGGLVFIGLLGAFLLNVTGASHRSRSAADELHRSMNDLKATQSKLVESEKLASIGGTLSSLAHELNTPIGVAITAVSTIASRAKSLDLDAIGSKDQMVKSDIEKLVAVVSEGASIAEGNLERAAQLIRSYKDVAVDRATDQTRKLNVLSYIEEILLYLRPQYKRLPHKIEVNCPDDIEITTVPGAFSQVIINLINNSLMHAFDVGQVGKIQITVVAYPDKAQLIYEDNGRGIPAENRHKVYEPYFSTGKVNGGSGLGLPLVKTLVEEKLIGTIQLSTVVEKGVRFEIELPIDVNETVGRERRASNKKRRFDDVK